MESRRSILAAAVLGAVALTACGGADEPPPEPTGEEPAAATAEPQDAATSLPDTLPAEVWAHLQAQDYQASWELWPGKGELYEGTEPHGMLLTTYANGAAMRALRAGTPGDVPDGGIVVKENYMPDSTLAAVTVMYKVAGYNPEHQDWWFLMRAADGTVEASGRAEGCQACHTEAPGSDYLYTPLPGEAAGDGAGGGG